MASRSSRCGIEAFGGDERIVMAARYSHLSPDHKQSVVERITAANREAKPKSKRTGTRAGTKK
jgi:hypothetical protein